MSYRMHPKQLENIFALDSKDRFIHFIGKVCDWEELCVLSNENGLFLTISPEGDDIEYMPVWPHKEFAYAFRKNEYEEFEPNIISLKSFMDKWLDDLDSDGIKVGVLPNLETTVWIIDPSDLKKELKIELSNYE